MSMGEQELERYFAAAARAESDPLYVPRKATGVCGFPNHLEDSNPCFDFWEDDGDDKRGKN